MEVEVAVLSLTSLFMVSAVDVKQYRTRTQKLRLISGRSAGGRARLHIPNKPYDGFCGRRKE